MRAFVTALRSVGTVSSRTVQAKPMWEREDIYKELRYIQHLFHEPSFHPSRRLLLLLAGQVMYDAPPCIQLAQRQHGAAGRQEYIEYTIRSWRDSPPNTGLDRDAMELTPGQRGTPQKEARAAAAAGKGKGKGKRKNAERLYAHLFWCGKLVENFTEGHSEHAFFLTVGGGQSWWTD